MNSTSSWRVFLHRLLCGSALVSVVLAGSGCTTVRSVGRFFFPKSPNSPAVARKDLPVAKMGGVTALVNGEPAPLARMQSVLTPGSDGSVVVDGRYRATEGSNEDPNFAARRLWEGADFRVLYVPEEDHGSYDIEGGRAVVKVTDDSMRPGAFTPLDRGGGRLQVRV